MSTTRLLSRSRRLAPDQPPGTVLTDLQAGHTDAAIAHERGLPVASVHGVRSFYDQLGHGPHACDGTACHFARGGSPHGPIVRCLGMCYAAPSSTIDLTHPIRATIPFTALTDTPVILRNVSGPRGDEYALPDAAEILPILEAAGLRGRGGAAFPTAAKWRAARDTPAPDRYVVANGDEGDPGSFVDRLLLEDDPHAVLAGMLACARAIGARRGVVYIRAEYPRAQERMRAAVAEAPLGDFRVEVRSGAGSYVCGEETALLRSIEGQRGEPSPKPPYPSERGLYGLPTVVQNVETLSLVPWILRNRRAAGTKGVSVSGAVLRTGLVEAPLGMPIAEILHRGAGGPAPGRTWKMALVGGPMGRVLSADEFETPLSYDDLPGMGHAGIVVLDDTVTPRALAEHLYTFAAAESCGTCTPCRVGTAQLANRRDRPALERLLDTLEMGSLCGFGQGVPRPIRDLLRLYGDEVLR